MFLFNNDKNLLKIKCVEILIILKYFLFIICFGRQQVVELANYVKTKTKKKKKESEHFNSATFFGFIYFSVTSILSTPAT